MESKERLVPRSIEAEEAVIASCLIDSNCYADVRGLISPADFHDIQCKDVFVAIEKVAPGIDQYTVQAELGNRIDTGYLSRIIAHLPTSVHALYYADIVARRAYERRMILAAGEIASRAYECRGRQDELLSDCQEILARLTPGGGNDLVSPQQHAEGMLAMVNRKRQRADIGLEFGYRDIDALIGGMYPGNLVVVGARPGMGKTQLLQEIALHNAYRDKHILVASRELSVDEWDERHIQMHTGISIKQLRAGELDNSDWANIQDLIAGVSELPMSFLKSSFGVGEIEQKARVLKRTIGLDLVIVDYIQLLSDRSNRKRGDTLRERIGYISNSLKALARDVEVVVLAASQLNRDVEGRESKRPTMGDLRESGDIEQDADIILLLHRPEIYDPGKEKGIMHVGVAKIRQIGEVGTRKLVWLAGNHRYGDYTEGI